jgi:hypothetical protein
VAGKINAVRAGIVRFYGAGRNQETGKNDKGKKKTT